MRCGNADESYWSPLLTLRDGIGLYVMSELEKM